MTTKAHDTAMVTQADRELVAGLIEDLGETDQFECEEIRLGLADEVQAVQRAARHRTASQAELLEALAIVRGLLHHAQGQPTLEGDAYKVADATIARIKGEQS